MSTAPDGSFRVICEVEPATRPELERVRNQIAVLGPVASALLVPDNHIGRASVSSVAIAHEVTARGFCAVACLNARDRNVLGLRRDLLTAAAYGVSEVLFVYGDRQEPDDSGGLTVRRMIEEARSFSGAEMTVGVSAGLTPLPTWKLDADEIFGQVSFDVDAILRWRDQITFDGPVYAGVMVVASASMAERLTAQAPQLAIPDYVVSKIEGDPKASVEIACDLVCALRDSGALDGVHLIPVGRYREVATQLGYLL